MSAEFATEAEMISVWLTEIKRRDRRENWTVYPETAGWDLLLAHKGGWQLGIEAKLSLNAKVIDQALDGAHKYYRCDGPDFRGVLVPDGKVQLHLGRICRAIGICVLTVHRPERGVYRATNLPDEDSPWCDWPNWMPGERCPLPDYIPDVAGGCSSPVQLTAWKVKAIKLMIILERRGFVTRRDMKALAISPTRWCCSWSGYLDRSADGYVRNKRTPNLRAQHPVNYIQIEADFAEWSKLHEIEPVLGVVA